MKILLINGSARKNGGCFRALEEIKLDGNKFTLNIKPFEIVTIKVK